VSRSSAPLSRFTWPLARLAEAMETLATACKLPLLAAEPPGPPTLPDEPLARGQALDRWLGGVAANLGLEVEATEAPYPEAASLVCGAGPAIVRLQRGDAEEERFLLLLEGRGAKVTLIGPDRARGRVPVSALVAALCSDLEAPLRGEVERMLERAGVPEGRRPRARTAILRERLGVARIRGCWLLRLPPGVSFWKQMVHARLPRRLVTFFMAHLVQHLVMLASWWVVGNAALQGHFDRQWLLAWVLLLLSQVPLSVLVSWTQGTFAIGVGALLKLRLLVGALRLEPEEIRHQGAGQLLGQVIESGAVESMALSAGFSGVMAVVELISAGVVLSIGTGGGVRLLLFAAWIILTCVVGWRYFQRRTVWTTTRLEMTNDLVERMVGHRTRIAQERRERWHDGEDQLLSRYLDQSGDLDRTLVRFSVLLSRGWMVVGLLGLLPIALGAGAVQALAVALALGGIVLASRALGTLAGSIGALTATVVAWRQVAPLFHAAERESGAAGVADLAPVAPSAPEPQESGDPEEALPVMEAHDLVFRYRDHGEPVLRGCSLVVQPGDRLLLEGPSGGGKTTLASVLVGLRQPESGLLLLKGLDRQSLGARGWRRQVVAAPQFHENHVMTGTLAFNLLMGRRWPPEQGDMEEAEVVCKELGLGPLLERMPAGLLQVVGETGWRLSHGEQSRIFIARALLQRSELMVLDESFAALDPESLRTSLQCVLRRAPALLVIAHP
jgi:ABC-type multidrug transport system fused ATPase/permease subunit